MMSPISIAFGQSSTPAFGAPSNNTGGGLFGGSSGGAFGGSGGMINHFSSFEQSECDVSAVGPYMNRVMLCYLDAPATFSDYFGAEYSLTDFS